MTRSMWGGWRWAAVAAVWFAVGMPTSADELRARPIEVAETVASPLVSPPAAEAKSGGYRLMDTRIDYPASWRVAQASPTTGTSESAEGNEDEPHQVSASELNRQLSNPVTSLWSLTFQFNNYRLDNGEWNYNLQFQP